MESYDPRNPIIKATENESDEVQGHSLPDTEQPDERILRATEGSDELTLRAAESDDAEVAGHSQDGPDERILRATEGSDELTLRATEGPDEARWP